MVTQATPQPPPFIVRQDVISQCGMAERAGLFRQTVDYMPEVDTPGPHFPFFRPDPGAAHDLVAAHVTTQAIVPLADT